MSSKQPGKQVDTARCKGSGKDLDKQQEIDKQAVAVLTEGQKGSSKRGRGSKDKNEGGETIETVETLFTLPR